MFIIRGELKELESCLTNPKSASIIKSIMIICICGFTIYYFIN